MSYPNDGPGPFNGYRCGNITTTTDDGSWHWSMVHVLLDNDTDDSFLVRTVDDRMFHLQPEPQGWIITVISDPAKRTHRTANFTKALHWCMR